MSRILMRLAASMVIVLIVADVRADDEEQPTISRDYRIKVKNGHEAAFEAGMSKQIEWYKQNDESWHWHTWQWETGDHTGEYIFRSPGHDWKDMDDRGERAVQARAQFHQVAMPHVDVLQSSLVRGLPKVSHWPDTGDVPAMVTVYTYQVHFGRGEEFMHLLEKMQKAILETGWDVEYAWLSAVSGTESGTYYLVIPHKNWADMEGPEKPFWKMMEETVGRTEAQLIREGLVKCVKSQKSALARFRPELSYMPADD